MKPSEKIQRAMARLILDHPFYGTLAMRLPLEEDAAVDTACTNGRWVRYNPKWIDGLTDAEVVGVMAHEVMHVAYGHVWRRDERDAKKWNVACDHAINHIILDSGMQLPAGALHDAAYCNESAEGIYVRLPDFGCDTGGGDDPGGCGGVEDAPGDESAQRADEAEWQVATVQAAKAAQMRGDLPGSLKRLMEQLADPKVPWQTVLRDFIVRTAKNDYAWHRPNTRYLSGGFVLPGLISDELPAGVLVIDSSGSTDGYQQRFGAEVSSILEVFNTRLQVLYVDARVNHAFEVGREDLPLQLEAHGGGGTNFCPAFEWVDQNGNDPAFLVYLTDMEGRFPADAPSYPVLWVDVKGKHDAPPFGDVVEMEGY